MIQFLTNSALFVTVIIALDVLKRPPVALNVEIQWLWMFRLSRVNPVVPDRFTVKFHLWAVVIAR